MRHLVLIIAIAGAYALFRGWQDAPGLLTRSCLAVATLVAGLMFWGIRRNSKHPRMLSLRRATWLDYLSLGAAIILTEACFVIFTSTLAAPTQHWATTVTESILDESKPRDHQHGENPQLGGNELLDNDLDRSIPKKSNYKPSTKPEVFIEVDSQQDVATLLKSRIHLRAFALSRFDGIKWSATARDNAPLTSPITFPHPQSHPPIKHRVHHAALPSGQNIFRALHGVVSTDVPDLTRLAEDIYLLPKPANITDGYSYTASSSPVHFIDLINQPIQVAKATEDELAIPVALAERLVTMSKRFKEEPDLSSQLIALRHYLQDHYQYSLETTNVNNANPLENFLYQEKRGFCEHFASAAAVLCRTLGIPSRVAYGWSGGKLYPAQNMFVFRAKDAHAWTEIKLEGYGWVVFDTTPPDHTSIPETNIAPENEIAPDPQEALAAEEQDPDNSPFPAFELHTPIWIPLTALGIIAGSCLIFLIARFLKRPATTPDGRPIQCPPPAYLSHFKQICATIGHPMPSGRTLRQHIQTLKEANTSPHFADDLLHYHYGITYGETNKNKSAEKTLTRAISQWGKHHRETTI